MSQKDDEAVLKKLDEIKKKPLPDVFGDLLGRGAQVYHLDEDEDRTGPGSTKALSAAEAAADVEKFRSPDVRGGGDDYKEAVRKVRNALKDSYVNAYRNGLKNQSHVSPVHPKVSIETREGLKWVSVDMHHCKNRRCCKP